MEVTTWSLVRPLRRLPEHRSVERIAQGNLALVVSQAKAGTVHRVREADARFGISEAEGAAGT